jgi:outer membrane protein TolC
MKSTLIRATLFVASLFLFADARAATVGRVTHSFNGDMTLDQAVQLALKQNPDVLRAFQQIELTRGQIIEVRAQGLPHIILNGSYNQEAPALVQSAGSSSSSTAITPSQLTAISGVSESMAQQLASALNSSASSSSGAPTLGGLDKSWIVTVQATQVLYAGGAVQAANRIAKFTDDTSYFSLRNTVDQTIDTVRQQFYTVLLDRELIKVQAEALRLLADQLKDQQNRFEAGTVPRFNVLQAEVALENQRPILIAARNAFTISVITLSRTLGLDPGPQGNPTFNAVGELAVHERPLGLRNAIELGIERRPFLKVQRLAILIQKEQIKVALAGYKPQLNANVGYELRNSILSNNLDNTVNGWFFGVTGQWNIFDGFETFGKVKMARANLETARITYEDSVHQVELEVQQAYANLQTARETIRSGQKTVEQALEALRLAKERLAAGAGVQLDVLNAQVQLTTAESTELQARANYNTALAEFDRVTATDTVYSETFDDPLTHHGKKKAPPAPAADQQDNSKKKNK